MALLIDHQAISVAAGSRSFGPVTIPDGLTRVILTLDRKTTAAPTFFGDGVSVKLSSEASIDGGMTWLQWLGFAALGGILSDRGVEIPASKVAANLPSGTNRRLRLAIVVTGGTLVSQLTVEVV